MSSTSLALIENQLRPMAPHFAEALGNSGLSPEKLIRTTLVCLQRTPALLECTSDSIMQSAMTAAVLGLEADGATGQFFMLPFKSKGGRAIAQPVIGYKGFNTIAARNGYTITGDVVRAGDDFDFDKGTNPFVKHRPKLGAGRSRDIEAVWAAATRPGFSPIVEVLDISEIMFVKGKSPGARMSDSPWRDDDIGFPAMAAKTGKRRLARSMPLGLTVRAAAVEEMFDELGKSAYLDQHGTLIVDGHAEPLPAATDRGALKPAQTITQAPTFWIHKNHGKIACNTIEEWRYRMEIIAGTMRPEFIPEFLQLNDEALDVIDSMHPEASAAVGQLFAAKMGKGKRAA